jgi:hypothetical protein
MAVEEMENAKNNEYYNKRSHYQKGIKEVC